MLGCATAPKEWQLPTEDCKPDEFFFVTLEGAEMEVNLCGTDTQIVVWQTNISVWSDECTERRTNLFTFWDGCNYQLYQTDKIDDFSDILRIGKFRNLKKLKEFLDATRSLVEQKPKIEKNIFDEMMKHL